MGSRSSVVDTKPATCSCLPTSMPTYRDCSPGGKSSAVWRAWRVEQASVPSLPLPASHRGVLSVSSLHTRKALCQGSGETRFRGCGLPKYIPEVCTWPSNAYEGSHHTPQLSGKSQCSILRRGFSGTSSLRSDLKVSLQEQGIRFCSKVNLWNVLRQTCKQGHTPSLNLQKASGKPLVIHPRDEPPFHFWEWEERERGHQSA